MTSLTRKSVPGAGSEPMASIDGSGSLEEETVS
jgi:hypothetical protein